MKALVAASVLAVGLVACSSEYIISTRDGSLITTDGKPRLDEDTGMYRYEDMEGRKGMVKEENVAQILQR